MDTTVMPSQNAVEVCDVFKSYGSGKGKVNVLKDLDVTVPRGAIYGLLGPSGCGKTTLLRCMIGRLNVDEGRVTTLGRTPGSAGHQVPGRMVGYMPQELALYTKFTIGETLSYFGRLHKMTRARVAERMVFLLQFLSLPEQNRTIEQLSGGQQRRTSFAIALLQEPELLILDEPTVGVDPLLRQRIWDHLTTIAKSGNTTILITTHYVEEARQAHMVGLMREGRMLAEAPPGELMESYNMSTLEEVFLKLCEDDQSAGGNEPTHHHYQQRVRVPSVEGAAGDEMSSLLDSGSPSAKGMGQSDGRTCCRRCCDFMPDMGNVWALFIKNLNNLRRQIGFLIFEFFLPALQITLFCICIGRAPYDLPMAVVNNETCANSTPSMFCLSTEYLTHLDDSTFNLVHFGTNETAALHSAYNGETWGVVSFAENFTADLYSRFSSPTAVTNATLEGSKIHVRLDMTNQQVSFTLQAGFLSGFEKFVEAVLPNPKAAETPVQMEEPIYGDLHPSFTNFMAPGIILSITFFMATGLTALSFVLERKQGLLDRSLVAGVSPVELMMGHISTQFLVMFVQVVLLLVFALAIFQVPYHGSLVLVGLLALLQGLVGMALGLLVSSMCEEETSAIQATLGTVYPNMLISGIIWPLQGMPQWLRYISYSLPMTYASEAMRSVLSRGWDLTYQSVWLGFVVSIAWGWGLMALSAIVLRFKGK